MFLTGQCKKCGGRVVFDIGDMTNEEVEAYLKTSDFGECRIGYHVELGKKDAYYRINWYPAFPTVDAAKAHNAALQEAVNQNIRVGG